VWREHHRPPVRPRAAAPAHAGRSPSHAAGVGDPPSPVASLPPAVGGVSRGAALARQLAAPRAGLPNRLLARDLMPSTAFLLGPGAASQIPLGAQRGPNPADGIAAVTSRLLRPRPASAAALRRAATAWADAVVASIDAGAAGSGAPHGAAIAANEADEIFRAVNQILDDYLGPSAGAGGGLRDCHRDLLRLAARKEREVRMQFHHGVIVETDARGWFGYAGDDDLVNLDTSLAGLPEQHAWNAPDRPLRFRRQMLAPGGSSAAGETDPATSTITLYSSGMQAAPYGRSAALGLPGFEQTIRHEIGHTVEHRLTPAARKELFEGILGWRRYAWHWITQPNPPYPTWREERAAVARETGLDGADLDAWLAGFTLRTPPGLSRSDTRARGSRSYVRSATQGDHLHSIRTSELPQGQEFDYALTEHNDYLSELYAFALSRPFWLATKISPAQKAWWRTRVFGTPGTDGEILRVAGMAPDAQMRYAALVPGLFTWPQITQAVQAAAMPANVA
jgi:hypothetical protein